MSDIFNSTVELRFWSKVKVGYSDECWIWQASLRPNGYGQFAPRHGTIWLAHRASWTITNGKIPDGMDVLHKCDNPPCVNPHHLFLGTQLDNTRDMIAKGRFFYHLHPDKHAKGENHGSAKLTEKQVLEIRQKYSTGNYTQKELAEHYGVFNTLISRITLRKIWKHI